MISHQSWQDTNARTDWYDLVRQGGDLIHATNPNLLILVGGVQSATDLTHVRTNMLDTSGWLSKHVWEFHAYSFTLTFPNPLHSCAVAADEYNLFNGFVLEENMPSTAPLVLSEFGVGMTGGPPSNSGLVDEDWKYLKCLVQYMEGNDADWAVWALQGSYYVRDGVVDFDEGWGLLDHDWTDWRNPKFPGLLGGMWQMKQGP
jgi:endoglucanase